VVKRTDVIWFTPDKPTNISVGRSRIADHLQNMGYGVNVRGTTLATVTQTLRERGEYDVVIGTTRAGAIAGAVASKFHGIPLVVDHVDPISQFLETSPRLMGLGVRLAENLAFWCSEATLYVYEEERPRIERYASQPVVTDLGVDFHRFAEPDQSVLDAGFELLPPDLERPIAVYIGGLEQIYHLEELLAAAHQLKSGSVLLAGDGSLRKEVERVAATNDAIHFLGTIPHTTVPGVLAFSDVGVSLVDDPHTLKVLEYGAAGLPVVQLDGRARSRYGDRVTYATAEPSDIAASITIASERDGTELQAFVERFDWKTISERYATVIDEAIG
jgi:glycosyltransferase involved in cell wall biosynthesis